MGSCMSIEPPPPPPVAKVVQQPVVYSPPSTTYVKPSAPPMVSNQGYTYAYPQQTQWVNPSYQGQMYPPQYLQYQQYQQYQQQPRYVVAQPYQVQQQQNRPGTGMAVAGGVLAGMLAANVLDEITDP